MAHEKSQDRLFTWPGSLARHARRGQRRRGGRPAQRDQQGVPQRIRRDGTLEEAATPRRSAQTKRSARRQAAQATRYSARHVREDESQGSAAGGRAAEYLVEQAFQRRSEPTRQ